MTPGEVVCTLVHTVRDAGPRKSERLRSKRLDSDEPSSTFSSTSAMHCLSFDLFHLACFSLVHTFLFSISYIFQFF